MATLLLFLIILSSDHQELRQFADEHNISGSYEIYGGYGIDYKAVKTPIKTVVNLMEGFNIAIYNKEREITQMFNHKNIGDVFVVDDFSDGYTVDLSRLEIGYIEGSKEGTKITVDRDLTLVKKLTFLPRGESGTWIENYDTDMDYTCGSEKTCYEKGIHLYADYTKGNKRRYLKYKRGVLRIDKVDETSSWFPHHDDYKYMHEGEQDEIKDDVQLKLYYKDFEMSSVILNAENLPSTLTEVEVIKPVLKRRKNWDFGHLLMITKTWNY